MTKPLYEPAEHTVKAENGETVVALTHVPEKDFIYAKWVWYHELGIDAVIQGCEAMYEFLKDKKAKAFLSDTRDVRDAWDEANEWIATDLTPRLVAEGLTRLAVIISSDLFHQLTVEELEQSISGFTMRHHDSPEEAIAWLEEGVQQEG